MVTTIAQIAASAFTAVDAQITGVVRAASMSYDTKGAYNPATGKHISFATEVTGGRVVVDTSASIANKFPSYVAGADDLVLILEGFTTVPQIGWTVTAGGVTRTIKAIGDIVGAGTFFEVVAA